MSSPMQHVPEQTPATTAAVRMQSARVLLAGLGNIGSFLAVLLAPMVAFIRLVDRDHVVPHNVVNQLYEPQHEGRSKVDVSAERVERLAPNLQVERRRVDLDDLPWEDFADVDVALAGLDSLRARQIISEKVGALKIPYIDGAVGEPQWVRVQVLLPGQACLECSWGVAQYRQLATEYPCHADASAEAPRTGAPNCTGAAAAAVMVAQCWKLFSDDPPQQSYEINGDLAAGRFVASDRRRSARCRAPHKIAPRMAQCDRSFAEATLADLFAAVERMFALESAQLEFPKGIVDNGLFAGDRFARPEQLQRFRHRRLEQFGLRPRDRVVVRANGQTAHIGFDTSNRS